MTPTIILTSLTQHIKDNPHNLINCSKTLAERLIERLPINLDNSDLEKLSILYQFIIMYSIVTSDLSLVSKIIHSPATIQQIVTSICDGSLSFTRVKRISGYLLEFTKKNLFILNNDQNITFGGLYFNKAMFNDVVLIVHDSYLTDEC